jgi:serine/threonine protein kinase
MRAHGRITVLPGSPLNGESVEELADRVKAELRARFACDERPVAWEYLERFDWLRENRDLAVSLIYEEFCLLEEAAEPPDPEEFCERYAQWRDSLSVQLRCHRELCELASEVRRAPPLLESGMCWNGFRIDSILGRGGTSTVYLAYEDAMGGRPIALKVSPDRGPEPELIGCLDHPRIMPAFSVCRDAARGLRGLCMPYRSGAPLDALLRRASPLRDSLGASAFWAALAGERTVWSAPSLDRPGWLSFPSSGTYHDGVAWIVLVIAQAASHMHCHGITHCDIKPSNVYVGVRDGPLLFDFGFARSQSARNSVLGGTLAYMAPEQLHAFLDPRYRCDVGPAADIYALGLTLAELLLGVLPLSPRPNVPAPLAARDLLSQRSRPDWLLLSTERQIPPPLAEIVRRCLAPSPENRYTDVDGLARSLGKFLTLPASSLACSSPAMGEVCNSMAWCQMIPDPLP